MAEEQKNFLEDGDNTYDVTKEDDMPNIEAQSTDIENSINDDEETDYTEKSIDMTKNELYTVLSMFLEDSNGSNLCETVQQLRVSLEAQTAAIAAQTQVLFEIGKLIDRKMRRQMQQGSQ